jgi:hypothetical protein
MGRFDKALDEDYQNQPIMPAIPPVQVVTLIDRGPQLPAPAPTQPDSTATPAQLEDYESDVAAYVASVLKFRRERKEFEHAHGAGPVELKLDPLTAREFKERAPERYRDCLPRKCGAWNQ